MKEFHQGDRVKYLAKKGQENISWHNETGTVTHFDGDMKGEYDNGEAKREI